MGAVAALLAADGDESADGKHEGATIENKGEDNE